jgi:hypothetical protein
MSDLLLPGEDEIRPAKPISKLKVRLQARDKEGQ